MRIVQRIYLDVYEGTFKDIGVIKKVRGKEAHMIPNNADLYPVLGNTWFERIINMNCDFCYVVPDTVRFWLHK